MAGRDAVEELSAEITLRGALSDQYGALPLHTGQNYAGVRVPSACGELPYLPGDGSQAQRAILPVSLSP